jgi:ribosomal protein L40E
MGMVFCADCKNFVSDSAKSCPKCGCPVSKTLRLKKKKEILKQKNAIKPQTVALVIGLLIIGVAVFGYHEMNATSEPIDTVGYSSEKVGSVMSGGPTVLLGVSKGAHDKALQALAVKDNYGLGMLVTSGEVFEIKSGTKVKVIDSSLTLYEVRVIEGPQEGRSGWCLREYFNQ